MDYERLKYFETASKNKIVPSELKAKLGYRFNEPLWESITEEDIENYLLIISEVSRKRTLHAKNTEVNGAGA